MEDRGFTGFAEVAWSRRGRLAETLARGNNTTPRKPVSHEQEKLITDRRENTLRDRARRFRDAIVRWLLLEARLTEIKCGRSVWRELHRDTHTHVHTDLKYP